ncbi:alpha/beta hydrolase [Sphingobium aromaticiconvertens]|uniref:alpha/beta hydrolase n=1 Tax=Sphingobium aromaticiconvertens TaxID=365341 RepID=UPI003016ED1A
MSQKGLDRRSVIVAASGLGLGLMTAPALAQGFPVPQGFVRFPLWKGKAPGSERVTVKQEEGLRTPASPVDDTFFAHIVTPTLTMLRPARPNGAAMLLIPGGGYRRVAIGKEGYAIARRFAQAGYTCFILLYRLPADGWAAGTEAPLQDAQRALRMVRNMAAKEGFDGNRIGVMGFSAGGHLAAWLTSRAPVETYRPADAIDKEPLHTNVAALMYPVIQMEGGFVHAGSRTELLGATPSVDRMKIYSMDQMVAQQTPPTFLAHAIDDKTVPVENSLSMLASLRAGAIPAECHLFETGGHGFGLTMGPEAAPAQWPELFLAFAKRHGV